MIGVDSVNDYYDTALKEARLALLARDPKFSFVKLDLADRAAAEKLFAQYGFAKWCISHHRPVCAIRCKHLIFASSSSVYGADTKLPFSVHDNVDHPVSLYGASKKANELMAHSYSHLYRLPATGLRFFTVYGPWGPARHGDVHFCQIDLGGRTD